MLFNDLQSRIKPVFKQVDGAVNIAQAIKQPIPQGNIAFVVPVSERPAGNSRDTDVGQPLQEVIITFGVVMGIQSINDATGMKGLTQLETLRTQTRNLLHGWQPPDHEPILLAAGDLVAFVTHGVWWIDRFTTNTWRVGVNT
jgi:hypothetical protein